MSKSTYLSRSCLQRRGRPIQHMRLLLLLLLNSDQLAPDLARCWHHQSASRLGGVYDCWCTDALTRNHLAQDHCSTGCGSTLQMISVSMCRYCCLSTNTSINNENSNVENMLRQVNEETFAAYCCVYNEASRNKHSILKIEVVRMD